MKKSRPNKSLRRLHCVWTVDDVMLLIESVKAVPLLWARDKRVYFMKARQWLLISQNVFKSRISPNELKQKWQNLRSQFYEYTARAEKKPNRQVRWIYYSKLLFLQTEREPIKPSSNQKARTSTRTRAGKVVTYMSDSSSASNSDDPTNITYDDLRIGNVTTIEPNTSSISIQTDEIAHSLDCRDEILSEALKRIPTRPSDDSQIFGDYVALQMRRLSVNKRLVLEVKIHKLIIENIEEPELKQ